MKNRRRLSVALAAGGVLLVTGMIGLSLAQQQARTAGRPPEPVYGFRLPDQLHASGLNAYGRYVTSGDEYDVYWNDGVNVLAGVTRDNRGHCDIAYFVIDRTTPDNWAALQGMMISPGYEEFPGTETCGFPPPFNLLSVPTCIENFLNQPHPFEGYDHIQFRFYFFTYLEDIKPEMGKVPLCNGDWGALYLWTKSECDEAFLPPYSPYHRITAKFITLDDYEAGGDGGRLYIERINASTWRIDVQGQRFSVKENYCKHELYTGKGKSYYVNKYYTSFEGCAYPVSYTLDLVKK